jgi:hypothetical protein
MVGLEKQMSYAPIYAALGQSDIDPEIDLIRLWIATKGRMFQVQGGYQALNSAGQLVYTTAPGSSTFQPHITASQAKAWHDSWLAYAKKMRAQLASDGRNVSVIDKAIADYGFAWTRYSGEFVDSYSAPSGKRFLSVAAADRFFQITGRFVRDLNSGLWAGYNINTAYQDFKWALDETTGGWAIKAFLVAGEKLKEAYDAVKDANIGDKILEAFGTIQDLVKWGTIAGAAYLGYLVYKKTREPAR